MNRTNREIILELKGIWKFFPGVIANQDINLQIRKGEIHSILGENGAGKTTLMNIIAGLYRPDKGSIFINRKKVILRNPYDAIKLGIGMVHQNFSLVSSMTVLENLLLGLKKPKFFISQQKIARQIEELSKRYNLKIKPFVPIWQLSIGEQQRVEILKLLYRGAKILILDEPTSALTPQEVENLFLILKDLSKKGKTIIFISHKLDEVFEISDRVTVLRKGKIVQSGIPIKNLTKSSLAQMMVGKTIDFDKVYPASKPSETLLIIDNLWCKGDRNEWKLQGFNLKLNRKEIVGIAGVSGNGQKELVQAIMRLRKIEKGTVKLKDKIINKWKTAQMLKEKVNWIPEDRRGTATAPNLSVKENTIITSFKNKPINKWGFINWRIVTEKAKRLLRSFDIKVPSINSPVRLLSGGNLQKLILAREFDNNPDILIAVNPTRGLDISATEKIHNLLIEFRDKGKVILLISEDLDEILQLSDRVIVIYNGKNVGEFSKLEADKNKIGLLMMSGKL